MNSTIPVDLFELKTQFETWRTNRKYMREPIPDKLWNAAADLCRRYPTSLVGRVLKLDPSRLKKFLQRPAHVSTRKKPQTDFFQLPTELVLPEAGSSLPQRTNRVEMAATEWIRAMVASLEVRMLANHCPCASVNGRRHSPVPRTLRLLIC